MLFKLSTLCILAISHFFLFQINAHMLSTYIYIYISSFLLHVSVFVTPYSGRPLRYLLKNCMLFTTLQHSKKHTVFEQVIHWSPWRWYNKHRNMYEAVGDKYMYLTYYVHLFGIKKSDWLYNMYLKCLDKLQVWVIHFKTKKRFI